MARCAEDNPDAEIQMAASTPLLGPRKRGTALRSVSALFGTEVARHCRPATRRPSVHPLPCVARSEQSFGSQRTRQLRKRLCECRRAATTGEFFEQVAGVLPVKGAQPSFWQ